MNFDNDKKIIKRAAGCKRWDSGLVAALSYDHREKDVIEVFLLKP